MATDAAEVSPTGSAASEAIAAAAPTPGDPTSVVTSTLEPVATPASEVTTPPDELALQMDPADLLLTSSIGVAARHGQMFLAMKPWIYSDRTAAGVCESEVQFVAVGSDGIEDIVTVPGESVFRVDFGPSDWGYAATNCGTSRLVVALRRGIDDRIEVVTDTRSGQQRLFEGVVDRWASAYLPMPTQWVSDTQLQIFRWDRVDGAAEVLDLSTGDVSDAAIELDLSVGPSEIDPLFLASSAEAGHTYVWPRHGACHGGDLQDVTSPLVIQASGSSHDVSDQALPFRGLQYMVFGNDAEVAWVNDCFGIRSVWTASVDQATGTFENVNELIDRDWLKNAPFEFLPMAIAFDSNGALTVWGPTHEGIAAVTFNEASTANVPTVVLPVELTARAPQLVSGEALNIPEFPVAFEMSAIAVSRAPGVAERDGQVFYGASSPRQASDDPAPECDGAVLPVYGFGQGPDPALVGYVPGTDLISFSVDRSHKLLAASLCGDLAFTTTGTYDPDAALFDPTKAQIWQNTSSQGSAHREADGTIRWGSFVLDPSTNRWLPSPPQFRPEWSKGVSDSGRFRYFTERGFVGDEIYPIDPALRLMVEDTMTGSTRPARPDTVGVESWRLIFGPGDEVAWMAGNELGTAAYLGRVNWSDGGTIHDVERLTHPYWGYPLSGAGDPGPDAIAFEPDGTLRAWAFTHETGTGPNPATSKWVIDSLTYNLDD